MANDITPRFPRYVFSDDLLKFSNREIVREALNRTGKYLESILPDFDVEKEKDYDSDPMILVLKVHIKKKREIKAATPADVFRW